MAVYNAIFRADQDRPGPSVSTGLPGVARRDLWLTHMLHLVPESPPIETSTKFLWVFLDKPTGSTAEFLDETTGLPSPTSQLVKFLPDVWGTYRVMLVINDGQYSGILLCAVILDSAGLVMKRGWRIPSFKEIDTEANFPGQSRGYAADWDFIFNDILQNGFGPGGDFVAGGDLSGTELEQTVVGLRARLVSSTAPTDGQILTWVAADAEWRPEDPPLGFVAGGDLSGTELSQTVIGLQGRAVAVTAPTDGQLLTWDNSASHWKPADAPVSFSAGGDLSGTNTSQTVIALRGSSIYASITPAQGKVLTYDGANSRWDAALPLMKKSYTLSSGEMLGTTLLANARIIGSEYFDPADWLGSETGRTRHVYFRVVLSSSIVGVTAYVALYDKDGITNGGTPILIASSVLSTGNVDPTRLSVDLTAVLGSVTLKGLLEAELYVSAEGDSNAAICQHAKLDVEWT